MLDSAPVTVPAPLTALPAANIGGDETSDDGDLPTMDVDDDGDDDVVADDENQEEERVADGVNEIDGSADNLFDNANLREKQEVQVKKDATKAAAQARRAAAANNATAPARGNVPIIEDVKTKVFNAIRSTSKVDCDSAAWNKIGGEAQRAITSQREGWLVYGSGKRDESRNADHRSNCEVGLRQLHTSTFRGSSQRGRCCAGIFPNKNVFPSFSQNVSFS